MYVNDSKDWLPVISRHPSADAAACTLTSGGIHWSGRIKPYIGDNYSTATYPGKDYHNSKTFLCKKAILAWPYGPHQLGTISYGMNLSASSYDATKLSRKINEFVMPSKTSLIIESFSPYQTGGVSMRKTGYGYIYVTDSSCVTWRHNTAIPVVFVDGHALVLKYSFITANLVSNNIFQEPNGANGR